MPKNQKNTLTLASLDETDAQLLAKLAKNKELRESLALKEQNRLKDTVNSFMEQLSTKEKPVNTLAEVIALIKAVERGTLGSVGNTSARTYKVLSETETAMLVEKLKAGAQVSALAKEFGVSEGKVWKVKTDAGLTVKRTATAPAAV